LADTGLIITVEKEIYTLSRKLTNAFTRTGRGPPVQRAVTAKTDKKLTVELKENSAITRTTDWSTAMHRGFSDELSTFFSHSDTGTSLPAAVTASI